MNLKKSLVMLTRQLKLQLFQVMCLSKDLKPVEIPQGQLYI